MSTAFFSDGAEVIKQKAVASDSYDVPIINYEIEKCVEWILDNDFSKIALQFPDNLLKDAADVALKIKEFTDKSIFILGDTSYGSCCVDEVAAEHVSAEAIIHFGHACLSATQRLPVLYIFGRCPIDVENVISEFERLFPDLTSPVIIYYEVFYCHAIGEIAEGLDEYENLSISHLAVPHAESEEEANDDEIKITKCQRHFIIPKTKELKDYKVFYIGRQKRTLTNVMVTLEECEFYVYDPLKKTAEPEILYRNRYLKRSFYHIEKARDAKVIGILVGTLGVSDYLDIIKHLRELIKAAGKKSYTLVVGKVNVAKLANFAEIEVFVSVACVESSVADCYGFYQPIITPYELGLALTQEWRGDFITDFRELLPGACKHISPSEVKRLEGDISLITGKIRYSDTPNSDDGETDEGSSALVERTSQAVSTLCSLAAGEYSTQRSWKGLEQLIGVTPVAEIQEGKKGIACLYDNEEKRIIL